MTLSADFKELLEIYPSYLENGTVSSEHRAFQLACIVIPEAINKGARDKDLDYQLRRVRGSTGQGVVAKSPWIRIQRNDLSRTFREHVPGPVILFSTDFESIFLTLELRTGTLSQARLDEMEERAKQLETFLADKLPESLLTDPKFSFGKIDLKADREAHKLAHSYQSGAVCSIQYHKNDIPSDSELIEKMIAFVELETLLAESDMNPEKGTDKIAGWRVLSELTDPEAVIQAIREFDVLGRRYFLRKYNFGGSKTSFVDYAGKLYDVKAIASVAHNIQFPDQEIIDSGHFSTYSAVDILQDIGFEISEASAEDSQIEYDRKDGASRRPPFNFQALNIPIGAALTFIDDPSLTCIVEDYRTVRFEDEKYYLSRLTSKIRERRDELIPSGAYDGAEHWLYENETIWDLRTRLEVNSDDQESETEYGQEDGTSRRSPRPPFDFVLLEIPNGSQLTYTNDANITCTVVSNRQIEYQGQQMSLSAATRIVESQDTSDGIRPGAKWLFEGESIGARRARMEAVRLHDLVVAHSGRKKRLILTANHSNANGGYDYHDVEGSSYEFPNSHRNTIVPGAQFIYYRGSRDVSGAKIVPAYFGIGEIAQVTELSEPETPAKERRFKADIVHYSSFESEVPFKDGERYLERRAEKARQDGKVVNLSQQDVRNSSSSEFDEIRKKGARPCWFVGAFQEESGDRTEEYIESGYWDGLQSPDGRFGTLVKEMQVGDRIAIKSSHTQKNNLPFDARGNTVSCMPIKAIGTITSNPGDGIRVFVDWDKAFEPKQWYLYTYRGMVWKVLPGGWHENRLIDFAFNGAEQDLELFPEVWWKDEDPSLELDDVDSDIHYFLFGGNNDIRQWDHARTYGFLSAGMGKRYSNSMDKLSVGDFVLTNVPKSGYVGLGRVTQEKTAALDFNFTIDEENIPFIEAFPDASDYLENTKDPDLYEYIVGVEWMDTVALDDAIWEMGMFANQNTVVTLDPENTRHRKTITVLKNHFPYLVGLLESGIFELPAEIDSLGSETVLAQPYSIGNIVSDGCFIPEITLNEYLERLKTKKNIILQGPPGTGKTWLAKKLGFALIGSIDQRFMTRVQFHPNLSYEDFIRGWRPVGDGKLDLADGPLMDAINAAIRQPDSPHVVVIEEINRGNPAQIFGEMLTLLESDKRSKSEALKLSYSRDASETVYVPDNLYLIGTMNIADRSLALVDLALRRRFAFLDLVPQFNPAWSKWAKEHGSLTTEFVNDIRSRINALNDHITESPALGAQFVVGHSYLTPHENTPIPDANEWFRQKVITEISPLLEEYWFDRPEKATEETQLLLEGI